MYENTTIVWPGSSLSTDPVTTVTPDSPYPPASSPTSTDYHQADDAASATTPGVGDPSKFVIPADFNDYSRLNAACYYAAMGLAVHPLSPSDRGDGKERGKKPLLKGWRKHTQSDVTQEFLSEYFGGGSTHNIGVVVSRPHAVVDLDSKADGGTSVMAWLAGQPELAAVPRERTGGGAHLHFRCDDIPAEVLKSKQPLVSEINPKVTAELFTSGNVVLSPSTHASGHQYTWDVTGNMPNLPWTVLCRHFGFVAPETKQPGRSRKEKPWWSKYPQDLRSLDLSGLMGELGLRGKCIDEKERKFTVRCPWADEHSGGNSHSAPQSDTVIFSTYGKFPTFKCLHAHCAERGLEQLLDHAEGRRPGIVADHCTKLRAWHHGATGESGRPQLVLPGKGRPVGEFAHQLGMAAANCRKIFRHGGRVVEVVSDESGGVGGCSLSPIKPVQLITAIESCVEVGRLDKDESGQEVFVAESMTESVARAVLDSRAFRNALPEIRRVLNVRIPMPDASGMMVMPEAGYDERFRTWLDPQAPEIVPMPLEDAKALLDDLLSGPERHGFWWKDDDAKALALARLLTPYCRGLMDFKRCPLWIFVGNRPGVGKDTCANVTIVLYTGRVVAGAPLSKDNDEEMRKRITAALLGGVQFLHIANMKSELNYASLEAATDNSGVWEDRQLGSSTSLNLVNEVDFSISANNAAWSSDIQRRSRVIELQCGIENLAAYEYRHPDILGVTLENRSKILSALATLVDHWDQQGRPAGPTPFSSFPEWGRVVGGVLACCDYPDPCRSQTLSVADGDYATKAMRDFFRIASDYFGDRQVKKEEFQKFIREDMSVHELFDKTDFSQKGGLSSFARNLLKYKGRELGGITFHYDTTSRNHAFYRFASGDLEKSPSSPSSPPAEATTRSSDGSNIAVEGSVGSEGVSPAGSEPQDLIPTKGSHHSDYFSVTTTRDKKSPTSPKSPAPVKHCNQIADIQTMMNELCNTTTIATDLEFEPNHRTGSTSKAQPQRLTLYSSDGPLWVIDLSVLRDDPKLKGALFLILSGKTIVAYDAKPLLRWLRSAFDVMPTHVHCIRTANRLLVNGSTENTDIDLDACIKRCLDAGDAQERTTRFTLTTRRNHLNHKPRNKVERLHELLEAVTADIEAAKLTKTWTLENTVLPVIATMEANGMHVDAALIQELAGQGDAHAKVLLNQINPETSRIHSTFDPLGAVTGRITSKEPSLQNIKRGRLREAFSAPEGSSLVVVDYSSIDMRIAAAEANDRKMIEAFSRGEDLYRETAARFLNKPEDQVTDEERQMAKAMNLGFINGQTGQGLVSSALDRYGVVIELDTASMWKLSLSGQHPDMRERDNLCYRRAKDGISEVRTRLGRRRIIPASTQKLERYRIHLNTPVQGGTADGMKTAMAMVHTRLPAEARIVSVVHDELIVECPDTMAESVRDTVKAAMIEGMSGLFPEVQFEAKASICRTWAEK